MKRISLLLTFLVLSNVAFSQFIPVPTWGVKGGFNFADIGGEEADNAMKTALHAGVYGQKNFNAFWHINIHLLLSGQGHGAKNEFDNKLKLLYLNLPLVIGYDPSFNFGFHAGLQPGLLLSAKTEFNDETIDVKDQFKSIDLGLIAGGSYYLLDKRLTLSLRYIYGFTSLSKSSEFNPDPQTRFNRVIQVSAAYMIARIFEE